MYYIQNQSISIENTDISYPNYREEIFPAGMDDAKEEYVLHNDGLLDFFLEFSCFRKVHQLGQIQQHRLLG
jgi:hypothetical protein